MILQFRQKVCFQSGSIWREAQKALEAMGSSPSGMKVWTPSYC